MSKLPLHVQRRFPFHAPFFYLFKPLGTKSIYPQMPSYACTSLIISLHAGNVDMIRVHPVEHMFNLHLVGTEYTHCPRSASSQP